jgi:transcriptional regulator
MYVPPAFAEPDTARLYAIAAAHPFATLVAVAPDGTPEIAHVPLLVDPARGVLLGHVARRNPLAQLLAQTPMTAVFHGPHGYVSPTWYASRAEVPTWNYVTVHARGPTRELDAKGLVRLLAGLAAAHETGPRPWRMNEVEPSDLADMLDVIVGFELAVETLVGKLKLGQNRRPEDRAGVRDALRRRGGDEDRAMLAWMEATGGEE